MTNKDYLFSFFLLASNRPQITIQSVFFFFFFFFFFYFFLVGVLLIIIGYHQGCKFLSCFEIKQFSNISISFKLFMSSICDGNVHFRIWYTLLIGAWNMPTASFGPLHQKSAIMSMTLSYSYGEAQVLSVE